MTDHARPSAGPAGAGAARNCPAGVVALPPSSMRRAEGDRTAAESRSAVTKPRRPRCRNHGGPVVAHADPVDRVSVKPPASAVLHAITYLLGALDAATCPRWKTGGYRATRAASRMLTSLFLHRVGRHRCDRAALWAAMAHRCSSSHFLSTPPAGRFASLGELLLGGRPEPPVGRWSP